MDSSPQRDSPEVGDTPLARVPDLGDVLERVVDGLYEGTLPE